MGCRGLLGGSGVTYLGALDVCHPASKVASLTGRSQVAGLIVLAVVVEVVDNEHTIPSTF